MTRTLILGALLSSTLLISGCDELEGVLDDDLTSEMSGDYTGSIVADNVIDTAYTVNVSRVDNETITIAGADFQTIEVLLMDVDGLTVNQTDDTETTLSWDGSDLIFSHASDEQSVTFEGTPDDGGTNTTGTTTTTTTTGTTGMSAAATIAGTYTGPASGPVMDAAYDLTVTEVNPLTVSVSGQGINTFEVPLVVSGNTIEQAGTWTDGSFSVSGASLSLMHTPQGLSFSGDKN